jgi:hypothetical protein
MLTVYTHDSELKAIPAPPPISASHKSSQHPLRIFQPALFKPAVPWQTLLSEEILSFTRSGPFFKAPHTNSNELN